MADFPLCYSFLLPNEAGTPPSFKITADPTKKDPDAKVCAGINSHFYPQDFAAIAALAEADRPPAVEAFYQREYWNKWLQQLNSSAVAALVMDSSVNQGKPAGVETLQESCNLVNPTAPAIDTDGLWGPATVAAANACDRTGLIAMFQHQRAERYRTIGGPNLKGWLIRAAKTPAFN